MRASSFVIIALAAFSVALFMVPPASAAPSISVQGYDAGGGFVFADGSSSIPVGATVEIRVWVDLYSCDPIYVNWGDGTPTVQQNYGGSFAKTWSHKYTREGTFTITATESECPGSSAMTKRLTIGGMGSFLDPSSPLFMPVVGSVVLSVGGIALANAKIAQPKGRPGGQPAKGPAPVPKPRLKTGIPADMVLHMVRLREVPPGAPMLYPPLDPPRIQMEFGRPTNLNQIMTCPACGTKLGYTVEGWFCMNPGCRLIGQGARGFPRNP